MYLYLDIETIPTQREDIRVEMPDRVKVPASYRDEAKIAAYRAEHADHAWRQTALSGDYGEIVVVAWAIDDREVQRVRCTKGLDEREMLHAMFFIWKEDLAGQHPTIVGHNVGFDLRFLHHRSVVHEIRSPFYLPYNAAPWQSRYVDTMYEWVGAKGGIRLTELCRVLGVDVGHEDTIDGSQVWDTWSAGDYETVVQHCVADVERVRAIHKRLTFTS